MKRFSLIESFQNIDMWWVSGGGQCARSILLPPSEQPILSIFVKIFVVFLLSDLKYMFLSSHLTYQAMSLPRATPIVPESDCM